MSLPCLPSLAKLVFAGCALSLLSASVAGARSQAPVSELPPPAELPPLVQFPNLLEMREGQRITSKRAWERERRPELRRLFQHYMYGYFPGKPERVRATIDREDREALGGKATLKEVSVYYVPEGVSPIHLLTVVPNRRKGPVPAFLGLSFRGNQTLLNDPQIRISDAWSRSTAANRATEEARGSQVDVWNIEKSVDRGYAVAVFYYGDVVPDDPALAAQAFAKFRKPGAARDPHDWGAVAAWAWGLQRSLDYLLTDRSIDGKRIAAVGHSRNGKAALVAAAFDDRFAMAIPLQAGCGGTAPSRGKVGESVKAINDHFPHWFAETFRQFNEQPERLPFDQHSLVALMAPRPVLLSNAREDTWANPAGQFEVLRAADPVYRLLGVEGLATTEMPPLRKLVDSRLGYFIRPGKHSMTTEDWGAFLDYADRNLRRSAD